ncbi:hypothetical protein [Rhodopirellula bahusiensis]|uniref:hypothetical protein n=1 Tax=Rhodopirellula bahusiensis TaxID=2014065 RepID=UPI0032646C39
MWMKCAAVALCLLAGCQEPQPEEDLAPSNIVEDESDEAIQSYLEVQDQNSRQMAEQYRERDALDQPSDFRDPSQNTNGSFNESDPTVVGLPAEGS